jgi:rare lipoprotein A
MSTLSGNAARLLAACLPVLFVNGAAQAGTCVSASWYHEGSHTASGERYRPDGLTAAHRSLRLGTHVLVTNKRNGHTVTVRINDRGPAAWTRRGIDLSRGAARALGMMGSGVAPVCFQVVDGGGRGSRHAESAEGGEVMKTASANGSRGERLRGGVHSHRLRRVAAASARKLERASARRAPKAHEARQARRTDDDDA